MPQPAATARDPRDLRGRVQVVGHVDAGYLSLGQAATYLGVSGRTIRRWIGERGLPYYYLPALPGRKRKSGRGRGRFLFRKGELDRWLRPYKNGLPAAHAEAPLDTEAETTL